ncbi:hypothetical protein NC652_024849 [Populus alba x Populus x berolinensis]|uniref:Uncharacterized protein n=1 Tax=Populus alba x Populus x berolinensis TaxID=444605 RepID=A0AAD6Q7Y4_9ROSI|nr:hypothetical protein NC652_024849 [Populus alba x Populus x berolinensis]KAJ6981155.1 hypothetical protein NC653_024527 [Populus alba x Populus x berolinensis]
MPESSWLCCSQCSSLHVLLSPERENTHETHAGELNKIRWFWSHFSLLMSALIPNWSVEYNKCFFYALNQSSVTDFEDKLNDKSNRAALLMS